MLATSKQISHLQYLTDRAEYIRMRHPSLIPQGFQHTIWPIGMTSEKASARITYLRSFLDKANDALYHRAEIGDIPA